MNIYRFLSAFLYFSNFDLYILARQWNEYENEYEIHGQVWIQEQLAR